MPATNEREFSIEVVQRLCDAGFEALWAGGCVRDLLLGREPGDYDVATNARPEEVRDLFKRTLNVGAAFGVMIVLGRKTQGQIEVATFRADGEYLDGRRPNEVTFCSAEHDALRRDFTINGMFYDPMTEEVVDYVGGREDLKAGVIRAIGNPQDRFEEDKLRLLRAVRFAARLNFELEQKTANAVAEMAPQITVVSAERIADELRKMLRHPNRAIAIRMARQTGLLVAVLPELAQTEDWELLHRTLRRLPEHATFETALAALLQKISPAKHVRQVCRRLKLANKESGAICWLAENVTALMSATELELSRLKRLLAKPLAGDLIELIDARAEGTDLADAAFCREYLATTPPEEVDPPPLLTGDDLIQSGFQPGPQFKPLLDAIRDAQLNGEIGSFDEAMSVARRFGSGV